MKSLSQGLSAIKDIIFYKVQKKFIGIFRSDSDDVLDSTFKIGQPFQNLIENDLLDIDLTPNRGDCFSHLGVAREVSILDNKKINKTKRTLSLSNQNSNIKTFYNTIFLCGSYYILFYN